MESVKGTTLRGESMRKGCSGRYPWFVAAQLSGEVCEVNRERYYQGGKKEG